MRARPRIPASLSPREAQQIAAGFLAARRWHGTATMTAGTGEQTGGQQGGAEGGQQSGEAGAQGAQQGGQPTGGGQGDDRTKPKFSIDELDQIIGKRVSEEQAKWQKKLDDAAALAGKSETDKLTIERDQAKAAVTETQQKAAQRIARTEAKGVARDLDARPDRLDAILRQADLTKAVGEDGEVDEAAVKTAVEKVLTDYPEWKKTAGGPTASGGELNGGNSGKPTFTRKQLEEMGAEEMAARIDEINEAIADGRVTG